LVGFATAAVTVTLTVKAAITSVMTSFLTIASLHIRSDNWIEPARFSRLQEPAMEPKPATGNSQLAAI
jgi:hypothetical protein